MALGDMGEIVIEGPTVARSYLKVLGVTHRVFNDPSVWLRSVIPGEDWTGHRLCRTGVCGSLRICGSTGLVRITSRVAIKDLGQQNLNGSLDFVSRIDSQVKLTGHGIDLGELEHYIPNHAEVGLCIVLCSRIGSVQTVSLPCWNPTMNTVIQS